MDYDLANSARHAALQLSKKYETENNTVWFQGSWGFNYYMEKAGATKMDFLHPRLATGDLMVVPMNNTNVSLPHQSHFSLVETVSFPASRGDRQ